MRPYAILISLLILSCNSKPKESDFQGIVEGDWLVIAPDHKLETKEQREIYAKIQDSITDEKALKLVRFLEDGTFYQVDNPDQKGKWAVSPEKDLYVDNGGAGFQDFRTKFSDFTDYKLKVVEQARTRGQSFKLVWHMKKIFEPGLVKPESNTWRKKPTAKQSEQEIKQRLATILKYYAAYFKLVADESIFFMGTRVKLPFKYYQHGMGMADYNSNSEFANLFFDNEQAGQAYGYLNSLFDRSDINYPSGKNYVDEYSMFMGKLAKVIIN